MRILLIGATGTIGKAIAAALGGRHEVLLASRQQAPLRVDIADPASIRSLYAKVGKVGAAISLVNAGLEGFARAAALEAPRGIRINVVSPPWVTETLQALGMPLQGGLPAATVAQAYVGSVEGTATGQVISP